MTVRDLTFGDSSVPQKEYPAAFDGWAFYIGGDTPHVWTRAEVDAITTRFRLPIFVRSDPQLASPVHDADVAVTALKLLGAPRGSLVAWDSETSVDPTYIKTVYGALHSHGYALLDYGSQSHVFENENPDGYYWGADPTGRPHIVPGDEMTQFAWHAGYDEDLALANIPFWDTKQHHVARLNFVGMTIVGVTDNMFGRVSVYAERNQDRSLWVSHELHNGNYTAWRQLTEQN